MESGQVSRSYSLLSLATNRLERLLFVGPNNVRTSSLPFLRIGIYSIKARQFLSFLPKNKNSFFGLGFRSSPRGICIRFFFSSEGNSIPILLPSRCSTLGLSRLFFGVRLFAKTYPSFLLNNNRGIPCIRM